MKERCEISKVNKSIGGNKRIGGTFCWKLIKEWSLISAYRQDFFSFSNKRSVRLFGTLEYVDARAEMLKKNIVFWGDLKALKFSFEIYWPLTVNK